MKSRNSLDELENWLKSKEPTLEKAFLDALEPMLFFNEEGKLIGKNRRANEYWSNADDFVPPSLMREVLKVQKKGKPYYCEKKDQLIRMETKQGVRFFLPGIFRLFSESGQAAGTHDSDSKIVACMLRDETGWELSERIRSILFTCISHELNTPLTSARLTLYLLSEEKIGQLNKQQRQLVNSAKQDLDREITSISNLLDLVRSDVLNFRDTGTSPLNVQQLIEESVAEFNTQINSLKLDLKCHYSPGIPDLTINHDAARLIVSQIIACFIKYAAAGAAIEVTTRAEDDMCRLEFVIRTESLLDFIPQDLFLHPMESDRMRSFSCADLCIRVAYEIIKDLGGELGTKTTAEDTIVYFHFPLSDIIS